MLICSTVFLFACNVPSELKKVDLLLSPEESLSPEVKVGRLDPEKLKMDGMLPRVAPGPDNVLWPICMGLCMG